MRTIIHPCDPCNGTGWQRVPSGEIGFHEVEPCAACDGHGGLTIVISEEFPPIPTRAFDYRATLDGYEGGDPQGFGATPDAAVAELLDQVEA